MPLAQVERDALEALIDRSSLANVLEALASICHDKAEHVETNWQDKNLAAQWRGAGNRLLTQSGRTSL